MRTGTTDIVTTVLGCTTTSANEYVTVVPNDELDVSYASYCPILAVVLALNPTYRVRALIYPMCYKLLPITAVIDSGAGSNFVRHDVVH